MEVVARGEIDGERERRRVVKEVGGEGRRGWRGTATWRGREVAHAGKGNKNVYLIAAEYIGVKVQLVENFELGVSSKTRVPVLETPDGTIFETNAIASYVTHLNPHNSLYSSSPVLTVDNASKIKPKRLTALSPPCVVSTTLNLLYEIPNYRGWVTPIGDSLWAYPIPLDDKRV
ncbi:hypothetical protein LguiA_008499 [Lonicera macranthoides]